jgi:hypothetical protein
MRRRLEYQSKRIVIDKSSLDLLDKMDYTRHIVSAQVNKIFKTLEEGGHFDSPIVVNKRGGKLRILDGGHRKLAIKKWIEQDPEKRSITVQFAVYENCTDEEEKALFTKWNLGKKQSSDDFISVMQDEIPIYKSMERNFPVEVRIYRPGREQDGVHFASLTRAYLTSKIPFPEFKVYRTSGYNYLNDVKELDNDDYDRLTKFCEFFENTFGIMEGDNSHQTTTMMNCLVVLFVDNVLDGTMTKDKFSQMCKRRIFNRAPILLLGQSGGTTATENAYRFIVDELRKERNRNHLKTREINFPASTGGVTTTITTTTP